MGTKKKFFNTDEIFLIKINFSGIFRGKNIF